MGGGRFCEVLRGFAHTAQNSTTCTKNTTSTRAWVPRTPALSRATSVRLLRMDSYMCRLPVHGHLTWLYRLTSFHNCVWQRGCCATPRDRRAGFIRVALAAQQVCVQNTSTVCAPNAPCHARADPRLVRTASAPALTARQMPRATPGLTLGLCAQHQHCVTARPMPYATPGLTTFPGRAVLQRQRRARPTGNAQRLSR